MDAGLHALGRLAAGDLTTFACTRAVLVDGQPQHVPSFPVEAVDTTGAGDCFNGALAVMRLGTLASLPTDEEVQKFLQSRQSISVV